MGSIYVRNFVFDAFLVGGWLIFLKSGYVKTSSFIVKVKEISDISNASIVNYKTAELLENKPKKTLEKIRSLDWYHIVNYYRILPELLTEEFISKYGNFNHMK
ncbi:7524_t:CDS:2 [Funneliformis geosporum]|uniref:7524_t:CDS:1 n=1 Tax=Funneliformis geosporum TaxID=1117311 RepID=A0A9W4T4M3_9GLOM|nr:7524_t:CDS:2 [Funneliformis geosporum]